MKAEADRLKAEADKIPEPKEPEPPIEKDGVYDPALKAAKEALKAINENPDSKEAHAKVDAATKTLNKKAEEATKELNDAVLKAELKAKVAGVKPDSVLKEAEAALKEIKENPNSKSSLEKADKLAKALKNAAGKEEAAAPPAPKKEAAAPTK